MNTEAETVAQTQPFQAEVAELLRLMVHAVYSETDVFLRELISNGSDACDKLRYEAIARPELMAAGGALAIRIRPDAAAGTLTITDTGIGMDRQELIDNLGTVARSGTRAFIERLAKAEDGAGLIGQFGVGFYSAFMVADRIDVTSRRAGAGEAFLWTSTGGNGFTIAPADEAQAARVPRGTEIVLHLKTDAKRYLEPAEIERVVHTYLGPHPVSDRARWERGRAAPDQFGERAVAAAEIRADAGGLHPGLSFNCRRVRPTRHDASLPRRAAASPTRCCCSCPRSPPTTCSTRTAKAM